MLLKIERVIVLKLLRGVVWSYFKVVMNYGLMAMSIFSVGECSVIYSHYSFILMYLLNDEYGQDLSII